GARNVASASVLAATLRHLFPDRPVTLLVGVLSDKDAEGIVEILGPLASTAVVTDPPWEGRLGDVSRLERALHAYLSNVSYVPNREEAFERARNATRDGGLVLVTGSLYLVAEVRRMILGSTA